MSTGDALSIRPKHPSPIALDSLTGRFPLSVVGEIAGISATGVSLDSRDVRAV